MVSGTKFGRRQQRGKSIFPLRTSQSFPQRLALAYLYLVIEDVVKEQGVRCCLQLALSVTESRPKLRAALLSTPEVMDTCPRVRALANSREEFL